MAILIWALVAALVPVGLGQAQNATNSKPQTITGVIIAMSPRQLTIQNDKGVGAVLETTKDYTDEVSYGSRVAATYVSEGGRDILQSMTPPLEARFIPPDEVRSYLHKVILLPETKTAGAEEFDNKLEDYLRSAFDWYVKPRAMAEEVSQNYTGSESALNLINPATGKFDMAHYLGGKPQLIKKIAEETRVDAVIEVSLERTEAKLDGGRRVARWDGYEESTSVGGLGLSKLTVLPIRALIPAVTASVKIWNAQGKPLWSRRRGFTVLMVQEGMLGKLRNYSLSDALHNQDYVQKWFETFFQPLLPPGEAAPAAKNH